MYLIVMPFVFAHGSREFLKPWVWSLPKPNMISTLFLAVAAVLPSLELEFELRQAVVARATVPATATALMIV